MPAICIGHIRVKNGEAWDQYRSQVGSSISQYGGTVLFRGRRLKTFSGEMLHENMVTLQFEDIDAANRWHNSPEYQALIPIREQGADVTLVLYEI